MRSQLLPTYAARLRGHGAPVTSTTSNARRRRGWLLAVFSLIFVLVAAVLWFFVGRGPVPDATVRVFGASTDGGGTSLTLLTGGCEGSPRVDILAEEADTVTVTVRATRYLAGSGDCQEIVTTELEDPLGNRTVIDGKSGKPVEVLPD